MRSSSAAAIGPAKAQSFAEWLSNRQRAAAGGGEAAPARPHAAARPASQAAPLPAPPLDSPTYVDGQLTGPFHAAGPARESPEEARRLAESGGAIIYINGIEDDSRDHRLAAQALARSNPGRLPVVGVYNQAGAARAGAAADEGRAVREPVRRVVALLQAQPALHVVGHSDGTEVIVEALWQAKHQGHDIAQVKADLVGGRVEAAPEGPRYLKVVDDRGLQPAHQADAAHAEAAAPPHSAFAAIDLDPHGAVLPEHATAPSPPAAHGAVDAVGGPESARARQRSAGLAEDIVARIGGGHPAPAPAPHPADSPGAAGPGAFAAHIAQHTTGPEAIGAHRHAWLPAVVSRASRAIGRAAASATAWAQHAASQALHSTRTGATRAVARANRMLTAAWRGTRAGAAHAAQWAGEVAAHAWKAVRAGAATAWQATAAGAAGAAKWARGAAARAGDWIRKRVTQAGHAATAAAIWAREKAKAVAHTAATLPARGAHAAADLAHRIAETGRSAVSAGCARVRDFCGSVAGAASHAFGRAQQGAHDFVERHPALKSALTFGEKVLGKLALAASATILFIEKLQPVWSALKAVADYIPMLRIVSGASTIGDVLSKGVLGTRIETIEDILPARWISPRVHKAIEFAATLAQWSGFVSGVLQLSAGIVALTGVGAPVAAGLATASTVFSIASMLLNPMKVIGPILAIGKGIAKAAKAVGRAGVAAWDWVKGKAGAAWGWMRHKASRVAESAEGFAERVLARVLPTPAAVANDGDLTGPFYPERESWHGKHYATPQQAVDSDLGSVALYVNGIRTDMPTHQRAAQELANQVGKPVVGIFNATADGLRDFGQCITDKIGFLGLGRRNAAIRTLSGIIGRHGDPKKETGGIEIYAHSQGSIIVSEALREARGKGADLGRVDVTTFGNAAWTMPTGLRGERHFVFDSDPVSTAVGSSGPLALPFRAADPLLARMGLHSTTSSTYVLHHAGSGIRPHGVVPDAIKGEAGKDRVDAEGYKLDAHGQRVYDSEDYYIKALPRFQRKEQEFKAAHAALGPTGAEALTAAEDIAMPVRSTAATALGLGRGAGSWASEKVGALYQSVASMTGRRVTAAEQGIASTYDRFAAATSTGVHQAEAAIGTGYGHLAGSVAQAAGTAESGIGASYDRFSRWMAARTTSPIAGRTWRGMDWLLRRAGTAASAGLHAIGRGADRLARTAGTGAAAALDLAGAHADQAARIGGTHAAWALHAAGSAADAGLRGAGSAVAAGGQALARSADRGLEEWSRLQRQGSGPHPDVDPAALRASLLRRGGPGSPPDAATRERLSTHFAYDLSGARLHTGPSAAAAARDLNAEAFTIGRDVFFGANRYDPAAAGGLGLVAHELTHVAQQTGVSRPKASYYSTLGGDEMEAEAQGTATRVLADAGQRSGLLVDEYVRDYVVEDGDALSEHDQQRLDRISAMALDMAGQKLGRRQTTTGQALAAVDVHVAIDLEAFGDAEAAQIWADAIIDAVRARTTRQAAPAEMNRALVQRWGSREHMALGNEAGPARAEGGARRFVLTAHRDLGEDEAARRQKLPELKQWGPLSEEQKRAAAEGLTYGEIAALSGDFYKDFAHLNAAPLKEIVDILGLMHSGRDTTAAAERATGGRYLALAAENISHFSNVAPGKGAVDEWRRVHAEALAAAKRGDGDTAYAMNAAADHFLMDAFCGGHILTARDTEGTLSAVSHNIDNRIGVRARNRAGDAWIAFGDGDLERPDNAPNRAMVSKAVRASRQDIDDALAGKATGGGGEQPYAAELLVPVPALSEGIAASDLPAEVYSDLWTAEAVSFAAKEGPGAISAKYSADESIREWIETQSEAALARVPADEVDRMVSRLLWGRTSEKQAAAAGRLVALAKPPMEVRAKAVEGLLSGWVSDYDLDAIRSIASVCSNDELATLRASVDPDALWSRRQRAVLRDILRHRDDSAPAAPAPAPDAVTPSNATVPPKAAAAQGAPTDGDAATITYEQAVDPDCLSTHTLQVLGDVMRAAGIASAKMTSARRTSADQARIMYGNLVAKGVKAQRRLYGPTGGKVIGVYERETQAGKAPADVQAAMQAEIDRVGPAKVSRHIADFSKLQVIDIAPSSIPKAKRAAFQQALTSAKKAGRIKHFIPPPSDPAFHIEVPQPRAAEIDVAADPAAKPAASPALLKPAQATVPLKMDGEAHQIFVVERGARLHIEMASERRQDLMEAVKRGLAELRASGRGNSDAVQDLQKVHDELLEIGDEVRQRKAEQKALDKEARAKGEEPVVHMTHAVDREQRGLTRPRVVQVMDDLRTIAVRLENIGRRYQIHSLERLSETRSKYVKGGAVKANVNIRRRMYGAFNGDADAWGARELEKLKQEARDARWSDIAKGRSDAYVCHGSEDGVPHIAFARRRTGKPHRDHNAMSVAAHWNSAGRAQDQARRRRFYNNVKDLVLMCATCNTTKAAKDPPYDPAVEPGFRGPDEQEQD